MYLNEINNRKEDCGPSPFYGSKQKNVVDSDDDKPFSKPTKKKERPIAKLVT
jgi:hypothetical protein